jgi:5-methylcytosine-specific restriction endonuclease McrA
LARYDRNDEALENFHNYSVDKLFMNAPTGKLIAAIDFFGCQHWSQDLPYRAVIAVNKQSVHGTVLYQVAGSNSPPIRADKALKLALEIHGGICFYCKTATAAETSVTPTIDHIEAVAHGGTSDLTNLVIACRPCNTAKGQGLIDAFNPSASIEWLTNLQKQIQNRLSRI